MNAASSAPTGDPSPRARPSRAELERIFGTEQISSSDDLPDRELPRSGDDWFNEKRPPHHG